MYGVDNGRRVCVSLSFPYLCDAVHVGAELVEEMVDDLRRKNADLKGRG